MSFAGYVCWNAGQIPRVINTEALQTENSVFLATHHPVRMYRQSLRRAEVKEEYDQKKFLEDFLGQKSFAFVPVLGSAGTGKSHLVRWLALNVPEAANRRIVLIPKGGTNLRDVIYRVLAGMEGRRFEDYRERLGRATSGMTDARARETLLGNLAVAIGPHGGGMRPGELQDVHHERVAAYKYLEGALQPLLLDDLFRQHLLRDEGIIADLVRHTMGMSEQRERREARREFSVADLPSSMQDVQRAGAAARQVYAELASDPWLQEVAVEWMNLHLDEAIGQLLQLGGDDLTRLMREVRAELAAQELELVLLIEDFAKLQGIERPLLEAVLEQPNQPDQELCVLRTALACTTDYFRGVADTVRDRTTFVVSLDREALSSDGLVTSDDFEQFAARYLNAIRLRDDELDSWYDRRRTQEDDSPVPNACERCPHQDTCHTAFGAAVGAGLYPFNRAALLEMYGRTGGSGFNPRLLLNDVLKHVVDGYGSEIRSGEFPSPALLASFGGSKLSAVTHKEIETRDPAHAPRRKVFVELWGGRQITDLDPGVHAAFRLPPLGVKRPKPPGPVLPGPVPPGPTPARPPVGGVPAALVDKLARLDSWGNGAELDQYLARELREFVYEAVYNHVDWDAELLVRSAFAGTGKPFKNTSVQFRNQATQAAAVLVRLVIPGERGSLTDAALALQGLLLFEHFGHWNFTWGLGGARYLRMYARLLDEWSSCVVVQIRSGFVESAAWDSVPAVVEVLAIGARLLGEPANEGRLLEHQIAALFASGEAAQQVERAPLWRNLRQTFLQHRQQLVELLLSRATATKGGSTRVQIVDATQFIAPLRSLQEKWLPRQALPKDLPKTREYESLRKLQEQFRNSLDAAIEEERTRVLARYAQVAKALAWEEGINEIGPEVRDAKRRAQEEGVYSGPPPEELDRAIVTLKKAPLVRWKAAVDVIAQAGDDRGLLLSELGQDHEAAARPAEEFVRLAEQFLTNSTDRVRRQVDDLEQAGGRDLEACYKRIEDHFRNLDQFVEQLSAAEALMDTQAAGGHA
jgi:hypothetical protein